MDDSLCICQPRQTLTLLLLLLLLLLFGFFPFDSCESLERHLLVSAPSVCSPPFGCVLGLVFGNGQLWPCTLLFLITALAGPDAACVLVRFIGQDREPVLDDLPPSRLRGRLPSCPVRGCRCRSGTTTLKPPGNTLHRLPLHRHTLRPRRTDLHLSASFLASSVALQHHG